MKELDLSYLYKLGYSSEEVNEVPEHWNNCILEYLSDNSFSVAKNMKYLQEDFEKDLLLKLTIFYPNTFSLPLDIFAKRISLLKESFSTDWVEIITEQFYGYDEMKGVTYIPFLKAMELGDSFVIKALDALHNPSDYTFGFEVLLSKIGIDTDELDLEIDDFLALEIGKYEIFNNAKMLLEEGMPEEVISQILSYSCSHLMVFSEKGLKDVLVEAFGENYVDEMERLSEEDMLVEVLVEL